jgi:hypothetical protein
VLIHTWCQRRDKFCQHRRPEVAALLMDYKARAAAGMGRTARSWRSFMR